MTKLQSWIIILLLAAIGGSIIYFGINDPGNRSVLTKSSVKEANKMKYDNCTKEADKSGADQLYSLYYDCALKYPYLD